MLHHLPWIQFKRYLDSRVSWGNIKDNAEQIGLAVKYVGLRPTLPIMVQSVASFFHLALPRRHEVCSSMFAYFNHLHVFNANLQLICLYLHLGIRTKLHAKAMMKYVYAFSRVAKYLCCIYHRVLVSQVLLYDCKILHPAWGGPTNLETKGYC